MPAGSPGTAFPYRGYRRGIFHGRQRCPDGPDLRPCREIRRAGHGGRITLRRRGRPYGTRRKRTIRHLRTRDIYTGTLGKAFGGALGGFTTGRKEIIDLLRQRSRPYLFSNSLAPGIIGASLEVFKMLKESNALHDKLLENVNYFRDKMTAAGFDIKPTQSAICAVMLYDAKLSQIYATRMQEEGIYVTGFYYPVVPKDQARIRVQISAGHEKEHLDKCIAAFIKVGKELGVLK